MSGNPLRNLYTSRAIAPVLDTLESRSLFSAAPMVSLMFRTPVVEQGALARIKFASNTPRTTQQWTIAWGDGKTTTLAGSRMFMAHRYSHAGVFTATATARQASGLQSVGQAEVVVENRPPTIAITGVPSSANEGDAISINSTATDADGRPLVYGWTVYREGSHFVVPDNTRITDSQFQFYPTDDGSYVVRLTVVDADGAMTTRNSKPFKVENRAPDVGAIQPQQNAVEGAPLTLSVSAQDTGTLDRLSYQWTLLRNGVYVDLPGDVPTTEPSLTFTPANDGTYVAQCVIRDDDGASVVVISDAFEVANVAPAVNIDGPPGGYASEGDLLAFDATIADPGTGDATHVKWSVIKDGQPLNVGGRDDLEQFSFTTADNGVYAVRLVASDDDGGATTEQTTIVVENVAPVVQIAGPSSGVEGTPLRINSSVTDAGAVDTFAYEWTVTKDGIAYDPQADTTSDELVFTPIDNGQYVVSLTVTDNDGDTSAAATRTVSVGNASPVVAIVGTPSLGTEGTAIALSSTVADAGVTDTQAYLWSVTKNGYVFVLPIGTADTQSTFAFTPDDDGTYVVTLSVTDSDGARTADVVTIPVVNSAPVVTMGGQTTGSVYSDEAISLSSHVHDAGWNDTHSHAWHITRDGAPFTPSGVVLTGSTLSFVPGIVGTYIASLTVTDNGGAITTVNSNQITVLRRPLSVAVSGTASGVEEGSQLQFSADILSPGTGGLIYAWHVTRDGTDVVLDPSVATDQQTLDFTATDNGAYAAAVTVTDNSGQTAAPNPWQVDVQNVAPSIKILDSGDAAFEGQTLVLSSWADDPSTDDVAAGLTYAWTVYLEGNPIATTSGDTLKYDPPVHGNYRFVLDVTDKDGATQTTDRDFYVNNIAPQNPQILGLPDSMGISEVAHLSGSTDDAPGDEMTYIWYVIKNGQYLSETKGQEFDFAPDDVGDYDIYLVAIDSAGEGVKTMQSVAVTKVAPRIRLSVPQPTQEPKSSIDMVVSTSGIAPDHGYVIVVEFGDGNAYKEKFQGPTELKLSHTYTSAGDYWITAIYYDGIDDTKVSEPVTVLE